MNPKITKLSNNVQYQTNGYVFGRENVMRVIDEVEQEVSVLFIYVSYVDPADEATYSTKFELVEDENGNYPLNNDEYTIEDWEAAIGGSR